jgi:hypothetical protein
VFGNVPRGFEYSPPDADHVGVRYDVQSPDERRAQLEGMLRRGAVGGAVMAALSFAIATINFLFDEAGWWFTGVWLAIGTASLISMFSLRHHRKRLASQHDESKPSTHPH